MGFALPESMRAYIDNRVAAGNHGNTSEYIRDRVRRDQEEQAKFCARWRCATNIATSATTARTAAPVWR